LKIYSNFISIYLWNKNTFWGENNYFKTFQACVSALESMVNREKMNNLNPQTMSPSQKARIHYKKSTGKTIGQVCQEMAKLDSHYSPSPGPINPFSHFPMTCSTNLKIVDSLYCSCFEFLFDHLNGEFGSGQKNRRFPPMRKSMSLVHSEADFPIHKLQQR